MNIRRLSTVLLHAVLLLALLGRAAEIKAGGLLVVDGGSATLTVRQEHKDANGSSTGTMTQHYAIDGATCLITR